MRSPASPDPAGAGGLVLGVDAGGTKTVAWLARVDGTRLGVGLAGPGNPRSVGFGRCYESLWSAIAAAFSNAGMPPATVASAAIGMAGADRADEIDLIIDWANRNAVARQVQVVNDALPVIAAGTPEGWGLALISGTGSFAVGLAQDGRYARAGGWGPLLGDEGSGYSIALAGLRSVIQTVEGLRPPTELVTAFMDRLKIQDVAQFPPAVYKPEMDRSALAGLAEVVFDTADRGDLGARAILSEAAHALAGMVLRVAERLNLMSFPLALAGGVLVNHEAFRLDFERKLRYTSARRATSVTVVPDPVAGSVRMACRAVQEPCRSG